MLLINNGWLNFGPNNGWLNFGPRTAYVHTHGSVSKGAESFSGHTPRLRVNIGGDIGFSQSRRINAYMASPSNKLYKFDYNGFRKAKNKPSQNYVRELGK